MLLVITLVAMSSCSRKESTNVNRRAISEHGTTMLANMMTPSISDLYHKGDTIYISTAANALCRTCDDNYNSVSYRRVVLID